MSDQGGKNRVVEGIIRSRGEMPAVHRNDGGNDDTAYQAVRVTEGFPEMGFAVFMRNGDFHGLFYHLVQKLRYREEENGEYITLSHGEQTLVIRGKHLREMFQAIMSQTLQAVYEYSEDLYPDPYPEDPLVNRIWIHDLNPPPKMEEEN
jgi:hypothetical protein